jgi:type IV secretory pathway VirB9-like protein
MLFVKLVAVQEGGMLSVTWEVPRQPKPLMAFAANRPPVLNYGRLFSSYTVEVKGAIPPPWMPVSVVDDGSKTLVKFAEALTYTRGPAVFGLNQQGGNTLVQSHMYVPPPGSGLTGAWMVVQGLHPALVLKDSAGLEIRIVRGDVRAPLVQGGIRHGS